MSAALEQQLTRGLARRLRTMTDAQLRQSRDRAFLAAQVFAAEGDAFGEHTSRTAWRALVAEIARRSSLGRGLETQDEGSEET